MKYIKLCENFENNLLNKSEDFIRNFSIEKVIKIIKNILEKENIKYRFNERSTGYFFTFKHHEIGLQLVNNKVELFFISFGTNSIYLTKLKELVYAIEIIKKYSMFGDV